MDFKSLISQLKLAYSPMSNYDFTILKSDIIIQELLKESSLYIIAQRPILSFEKLVMNSDEKCLEFEIHQKDNPSFLRFKLPLFQVNLATDFSKKLKFEMGSNNRSHVFDINNLTDIHGLKLFEVSENEENFLIFFSPEKFLHNYSKGYFKAEIIGNIRDLLNYKVHYVGKATEQDIWERLTGHETLQNILSLEYPFVYGSLPTHEIVLLLFKFHDNLTIQTFGTDSSLDDMVDSFQGKNYPETKTVFLDAEKALVKAMQPKHNKVLFKNYPKSKDGLEKHNFDRYSFTFVDPITLKYDNGEIRGGLNYMGGDLISIKNNKDFEIVKVD